MVKSCPRCQANVAAGETDHELTCLETQLVRLYQTGVKRGLQGEMASDVDDRAADLISDLLGQFWLLREAAEAKPQAVVGITLAPEPPRARTDHELDSQIARLLGWQNVGWLGIQAVSGEAAWHDPRVVRRRFSERYEDALLVLRLPLMQSVELVQIHRMQATRWEWHVSRKTMAGHLESIVRAPTAARAICLAAVELAGISRQAAFAR